MDRRALEARHRDAASLSDRPDISDRDVVVLAVHVHGWYTALETLLERVARLLDTAVPSGASWHAELISQMAVVVPGLRPAVIDSQLEGKLAEIRRFRHFFRNAYVLDLDASRVVAQARLVAEVHAVASPGLDALEAHLDGVLAEVVKE